MDWIDTTERAAFRRDIEGLRAVAVGLVIAFHFGVRGVPGGFVGVDVFFVISGYLITGLLAAELTRTGGINVVRFYARRTRRLLPAAFLVLAATLLAGALILSPLELKTAAKAAIASSLYYSNFWFMRQAFDYFSPESALNPFLHTWSLSVEEQFYFVWPAFLLLTTRAARRPRTLIVSIACIAGVSFAGCVWLAHVRQPVAFYASPARAWEFAIGAIAALAPASRLLPQSAIARIIAWAGVLAILGSALLLSENDIFPGWTALVPVLGTAAILFAGGASHGRAIRFLSTAPFQYIGRRSYGIYLWHWPVIVFANILWPDLSILGRLACLVVTLGLSILTFWLIENPIRTSATLAARPILSLRLAAILTIAGGAVGAGAGLFGRHAATAPAQLAAAHAADDRPAVERGCILGLTDIKPNACSFDGNGSDKTIVLFGDSHAAQWFSPIAEIAKAKDARLVTYLKSSCAVADVPVISLRLRRDFAECLAWRRDAIGAIIKLRPAAVIISQNSLGYVKRPGLENEAASVTADQWSSGLRRTLTEFEGANIPVVIIADTPNFGFDVPTCLARAESQRRATQSCEQRRDVALSIDISAAERAAASGTGNAHYVDMTDLFCNRDICPPELSGDILYRDTNHITEKYALKVGPELLGRIGPWLASAQR